MAKNMLKRLGRFELLELIYNMRKDNLELKERAETAEKQIVEIQESSEKKLQEARKDFESRIEELRMQGAAKDLQIRMKKIEEQLRLMQRLTSIDIDVSDMPSEEEIDQLAEQEQLEREEQMADDGNGKKSE